MAEVDGLVCFFDRGSSSFEHNLDEGDRVDVMFTGVSRSGSVLFMSPIIKKAGHRLVRHDGFRPRGKEWAPMASSRCPKGMIIPGRVPVPIADGSAGYEYARPGFCWVLGTKHDEARFVCLGVENPWCLDFNGGRFSL